MEVSEHQISEQPGAEPSAGLEDEVAEAVEFNHRAPEGGALESSVRDEEPSSSPAPEVKSPIREREISLLEYVSVANDARSCSSSDRATNRFRLNLAAIGLVAGVGCVVCIGAMVGYDRVQTARLLAAKVRDTQSLTSAVKSLEGRLAAVEVARDKDEAADLRRVLAEIKVSAAATRDFGTTLIQLSSRVDHIEKDQTTRFDKFGERLDHDTSSRLADISARLEKLEKKPATPVVTLAPTPPPAPPKAMTSQAVSNETTGSIDKPKPRVRGFTVAEVRDGYVVVESREGSQPVVAGDFIPGAGRVLRIERRGQNWTVVTTQGVITEEMEPY